jgi:hypothetical protein
VRVIAAVAGGDERFELRRSGVIPVSTGGRAMAVEYLFSAF